MGTLRLSSRGLPLVCVDDIVEVPTLTVENYCKWYDMQIIHPDGRVEAVSFGDLDELAGNVGYDVLGSGYVDHVPNPQVVRALAEARGWAVDEQAMEMIAGRWQLEVVG